MAAVSQGYEAPEFDIVATTSANAIAEAGRLQLEADRDYLRRKMVEIKALASQSPSPANVAFVLGEIAGTATKALAATRAAVAVADEVPHLRGRIAELEAQVSRLNQISIDDNEELQRVAAENERLREALEYIAQDDCEYIGNVLKGLPCTDQLGSILYLYCGPCRARAALDKAAGGSQQEGD